MSAVPPTPALSVDRNQPTRSARTGLMHRSKGSISNYLVGKREQRRRDFKAERLRGLDIDHQLEFARLYHGQVGGLFASQNATGIDAGFAKRIGSTAAVAHQSAGLDVGAVGIEHRQLVTGRKLGQ